MQANTAALASPALQPSTVRWKIFLMMLFLISINYIDRASLSVAMPLIAKEFDIGPATQGLLLSSFFWTYAFMQIPGGLLAWHYIRNHPREHPGVNEEEARYIEASHAHDAANAPHAASGRVLDFFKYRSVWGMFFGWMCFNALFYGLLTWMPNYLSKVH